MQFLKFSLAAVALLILISVLARCAGVNPAAPTATLDPAAALANAPIIALSPARGYAGAAVNVRGSGWPAAEVVLIKLADVQGHSPVLAATTVDSGGQFAAQFVYPGSARWLQPGVQTVIVQTQDNQVEVGASFLVISPEGVVTPTSTSTATPTATPITTATSTATATATPTSTPAATAVPTATIQLSAGGLAVAPLPTPTAAATPTSAPLAVPAGSPVTANFGNGYRIRFLGAEQGAEGSSIWRYRVEKQAGAKKLQVWGLELPDCARILDASPTGWDAVPAGGDWGLGGISWKVKGNFQQGDFAVTVSGRVAPGAVHVAAKAPQIEAGVIAGPRCR